MSSAAGLNVVIVPSPKKVMSPSNELSTMDRILCSLAWRASNVRTRSMPREISSAAVVRVWCKASVISFLENTSSRPMTRCSRTSGYAPNERMPSLAIQSEYCARIGLSSGWLVRYGFLVDAICPSVSRSIWLGGTGGSEDKSFEACACSSRTLSSL